MPNPITPGHNVGDPQCPYCRHILIPRCTWYIANTAFCKECSDTLDGPTVLAIIQTQEHPRIVCSWSCWHGLIYFVPRPGLLTNVAAHLQPAALGDRDPANVLSESKE